MVINLNSDEIKKILRERFESVVPDADVDFEFEYTHYKPSTYDDYDTIPSDRVKFTVRITPN